MPFPLIPVLMGAAALVGYFEAQSSFKDTNEKQNDAKVRYAAAKDSLTKKSGSARLELASIHSGIQAEFDAIMLRYRPIMECFGQAIQKLDIIPEPPGFKAIDNFVIPNISHIAQRITSPEIKAIAMGSVAIGLQAASDLMAAKMDIVHSFAGAKGGLRGVAMMQSRASEARVAVRKLSSEVDEYCSDAKRAESVFDEAIIAAKKSREAFDSHVAIFNRYIDPCEEMVRNGITSDTITSEQLLIVGYLYTVGEHFQKYISQSLEV